MKKKGKIQCMHCGSFFHPYRSGEIRLCKKCLNGARITFWNGKIFFTPSKNPPIESLTPEEQQVFKIFNEIITEICTKIESSWNTIESNLRLTYTGEDYWRAHTRLEKKNSERLKLEIISISKTVLARRLHWSRPRLYRVINPMLEKQILLVTQRGGLVPNIPLIVERRTGEKSDNKESFLIGIDLQKKV
jgi:hypothetical protein